MMKLWIGLIMGLMFSSCSSMHKEDVVLYRIIGKHASLSSKSGFHAYGSGGEVPEKIHKLIICYSVKKPADIQAARRMFLDLAKSLLKIANADPELPEYAANYPFHFCNMQLSLTFDKASSQYQDPPSIALVFNVDNDLYYFIFKDDQLVEVQKENIYDFAKPPPLTHSPTKI